MQENRKALPVPFRQGGRFGELIVVENVACMHEKVRIHLQHLAVYFEAVVCITIGVALARDNGESDRRYGVRSGIPSLPERPGPRGRVGNRAGCRDPSAPRRREADAGCSCSGSSEHRLCRIPGAGTAIALEGAVWIAPQPADAIAPEPAGESPSFVHL